MDGLATWPVLTKRARWKASSGRQGRRKRQPGANIGLITRSVGNG